MAGELAAQVAADVAGRARDEDGFHGQSILRPILLMSRA